jgi:hypothetical protein
MPTWACIDLAESMTKAFQLPSKVAYLHEGYE